MAKALLWTATALMAFAILAMVVFSVSGLYVFFANVAARLQ
jgi:hypothetical protein